MDRFWSNFGPFLKEIWTDFEAILDRFWSNFGPFLKQFWTVFEGILNRFWSNFGQFLKQFWIVFEAILDRFWSNFGLWGQNDPGIFITYVTWHIKNVEYVIHYALHMSLIHPIFITYSVNEFFWKLLVIFDTWNHVHPWDICRIFNRFLMNISWMEFSCHQYGKYIFWSRHIHWICHVTYVTYM